VLANLRFQWWVQGICVAAVLTISALLGGFYHFRQSVMDARLGKFDFQKKNAKSLVICEASF
jgi:hypothetical protein